MSNEVTEKQLAQVRDLLVPGVWVFGGQFPEIDFDITIDYGAMSLLINGYNRSKKRLLGFAITPDSIKNKLYVESFRPSVEKLAELLNQEAEPVGTV